MFPSAVSAFLKTIEEPPEYVVFIFATTKLKRIFPTIISRCQKYDFQRIPYDLIINQLGGVAESNGIYNYKSKGSEINEVAASLDESCYIIREKNRIIKIKQNYEYNDEIEGQVLFYLRKSLKNEESFLKLSEDKNKKFSDVVKIKAKTIIFHTAENDELSQTMNAFYFCDKSKQVLSDKQAAEYKAMHTEYDIPS